MQTSKKGHKWHGRGASLKRKAQINPTYALWLNVYI